LGLIVSFRFAIVTSLPARRSSTLSVTGTLPNCLRNCRPVLLRPTVTVTVCPPATFVFFLPTTTTFVARLPLPAARMVDTLPPLIVSTVVSVSVK